MAPKPPRVPAARLVGLAVLLVLSGVMPIVQPAEASSTFWVVGGPYFDPTIPPRGTCTGDTVILARPAGNETQVHTLDVNTGVSGVTNVKMTHRLGAAGLGTPSSPGLAKALTWNDTVAGGAGWSATANNADNQTGGTRVLTFQAQAGTAINPGGPARLTFAFEIPKAAVAGDSYRIEMSALSPAGTDSTSFCIRIDTTPPKLKTAVTRDTDYDGRIDMMELTFDESLDSNSLVHSEFEIREAGSPRAYAVLGTSPPLVGEEGGPEDCHLEPQFDIWLYPCPRRVILRLAPGPTFDTGAKPSVLYPAPGWNGTLTDLAGNRLAPIKAGDVNGTDGAKPIMVSALAKEGSNSVVVTFSEPVRGSGTALSGGARPVRIDSDDPAVCASNCVADFVYFEGLCHPTPQTVPATPACATHPCSPPAPSSSTCVGEGDCMGGFDPNGRGMAPQMTGAIHDVLGATANQVTITVRGGDGAHPWRYPKAWNLPGGELTGHGTPISPFPPSAGTRGCTNGQLGAGDTHKTRGDNLDLREESVPPTNCLDNARKIYDFDFRNVPSGFETLVDPDFDPQTGTRTVTCDRTVKDVNGLHALNYKRSPRLTITGPFVTEAEVNIDSFKLTLKFNGPVTSAAGNTLGVQLNDVSIVTADCAGQGPTGVVAINHTAGSDEAILTLDHRTRPCDLDDTPSRVRVSSVAGRGVKAFGQNMLVPSFDPDADSYPDVFMVDRTNPAFTPPNAYTPALSTVDANRNGYIDGVKVYFSEPIDDASFCLGPQAARPPVVCAGDGFFDDAALGNGQACTQPATHSILIVNNIPGPYAWDTDLLPDDNEGIIRFPETPGRLQATGHTPAISTNPCWTKNGYSNPATDLCNVLCRRGMGLFTDQFRPSPQSNPPYLAANYMKRVCGEAFGQSGPPLCSEANGITAKVFDGAPPALWSAKTLDTPLPGPFCNASVTSGCEGDGLLDGYVLTFSEPVNDCSFKASEWKVAGHTVLGTRTNVPLDKPRAICPSPKYPPQGQGNDNLVLQFGAGTPPDTDARPEITYAGPSCNSCGMRDLNGNSMAAFGTLAVNEEDDAPPVVFCARGFVGQATVTLEFSEPVDNGDKGGIVSANLLYGNRNQFRSDGASGFSGTQGTVHRAGDRTAELTLNGALTNQDIANDTVSAVFHAIVETAPTVLVKKPVSTVAHKLLEQSAVRSCRGIDTTAPANVTSLQVVAGLTSANAVTLSWTAPGNDGMGLGNVTGYRIKVSTQRITPADVASPLAPGAVAILATNHALDPLSCPAGNGTAAPSCEPACLNQVIVPAQGVAFGNLNLRTDPPPCALALPGQVQRATIVGLDPATTYHFAVVAFDNATAPNSSGMGAEVSAKTGVDLTPPAPAPVIFSAIPPFRSSAETRPQFQWSNATDLQSTVTYVVAIGHQQDLILRCPGGNDQATGINVGTATSWRPPSPLASDTKDPWTFHVAACSAGGQTATAHYTIIVGAVRIDPQRIENVNSLIKTEPYKLGEEYRVNWTLPREAEIRQWVPSGEVVGVQIWRLFCPEGQACTREFAAEIPGNYTTLHGPREWIDNQTAFATEPYYRVEMVFSGAQTQDTGPEKVQGFAAPVDRTERMSALVPLLGLILLAAACAALVAWAILASKKRAAVRQAKEEAPAGVDPETGLPTHDVKCPTCATPFQAVGTLPLQITCPNCGAAGILQ